MTPVNHIVWSDCSCCWPQKPFIRKAVGWFIIGNSKKGEPDMPIPPYWYLEIGGWPTGHYGTWEDALRGALRYLERDPTVATWST